MISLLHRDCKQFSFEMVSWGFLQKRGIYFSLEAAERNLTKPTNFQPTCFIIDLLWFQFIQEPRFTIDVILDKEPGYEEAKQLPFGSACL